MPGRAARDTGAAAIVEQEERSTTEQRMLRLIDGLDIAAIADHAERYSGRKHMLQRVQRRGEAAGRLHVKARTQRAGKEYPPTVC